MANADSRVSRPRDDDGFSLVEVIVAVLIFAIVATGVAMGAATALRMTAETRDREAAAQLASSEIDAVRAVDDPFSVANATRTAQVGGTDFTITRTAQWVQGSGGEGCRPGTSSSVSNLQYKRVNVSVTWQGQIGPQSAAHADTLLAPKSRLNDPSLGTILVSVIGADGTARSGVSVSVSGSSSLSKQPVPTDSDGCTYVLLVKPGDWTVQVSKAGFVDTTQSSTPSKRVTVTAGAAASALFQYDARATVNFDYPTDAVSPTDLQVSLLNTYGFWTRGGKPASADLHPYLSGYTALAGQYTAPTTGANGVVASPGCVSPDPGSWQAATVNGKNLAAGVRQDPVATTPGGSSRAQLTMGVIALDAPVRDLRIVAVAAAAGIGDPGCASTPALTYTYSLPATGPVRLAVPWGTWRVERKDGRNWTVIDSSASTVPTNAAGEIDGPGGATTVDPRAVAP